MTQKSLSVHPCHRHQLPSYSSVNNGHHSRFCLEPTIGRVRTKYRVRQQYLAVFELHNSTFATPTCSFINFSRLREGFQDTTKGLKIPSVNRLSLLFGVGPGAELAV